LGNLYIDIGMALSQAAFELFRRNFSARYGDPLHTIKASLDCGKS
jgi:hypothetical protein